MDVNMIRLKYIPQNWPYFGHITKQHGNPDQVSAWFMTVKSNVT